jgi:hypothetical protein
MADNIEDLPDNDVRKELSGKGIGSLYLKGRANTIDNKNKVYNKNREVLLERFNQRGKEIAYNQTKQEIMFNRVFYNEK